MNTLFLFSTASGYGGAEKSLEAVFPALAREFSVVVFTENRAHLRSLQAACENLHRQNGAQGETARIIELPGANTPAMWMRNVAAVRDEWRRSPPQVLLSNTNKGALWVSICQRFTTRPIPAFVFVRDFGWRLRPLIFNTLKKWDAIVPSPSIPESDYWRRRLAPATIHIIPNAAPVPLESAGVPSAAGAARAGAGYILCLANLSRWKGVDLLIRAFAEAAVPGLRLIVQGAVTDAHYRAELDELVAKLGLGAAVEFRKFGNDVSALYANSRCVAVPSISDHGGPESFGRTVIEAWAHGKPVVAFSCGGPKYLIRDTVDGFLVPEKDTPRFAQKLRLLALDEKLSLELGQAGKSRAAVEFSAAGVAAAIVHTLNGARDRDVKPSRV